MQEVVSWRVLLTVTLVVGLVVTAPQTVSATAIDPTPPVADTPLDLCIEAADDEDYRQWLCYGDELHVLKDEEGDTVNHIEKVAPDGTTTEVDPPPEDQLPEPTVGFSSPLVIRTGLHQSSAPRILPAAGGDFWDTWCETGSTCSRRISAYISETKGNAAYGNQNGAIGSYDVILRTNLNGRQAQWTVIVNWDSGPALTFQSPTQRCRQKDFWAALDCGNHSYRNFYISAGRYRDTSPILYGNRLNNAAEYYGSFNANFTPTGYPMYAAGTLRTSIFTCPSSGNCRFP